MKTAFRFALTSRRFAKNARWRNIMLVYSEPADYFLNYGFIREKFPTFVYMRTLLERVTKNSRLNQQKEYLIDYTDEYSLIFSENIPARGKIHAAHK